MRSIRERAAALFEAHPALEMLVLDATAPPAARRRGLEALQEVHLLTAGSGVGRDARDPHRSLPAGEQVAVSSGIAFECPELEDPASR